MKFSKLLPHSRPTPNAPPSSASGTTAGMAPKASSSRSSSHGGGGLLSGLVGRHSKPQAAPRPRQPLDSTASQRASDVDSAISYMNVSAGLAFAASPPRPAVEPPAAQAPSGTHPEIRQEPPPAAQPVPDSAHAEEIQTDESPEVQAAMARLQGRTLFTIAEEPELEAQATRVTLQDLFDAEDKARAKAQAKAQARLPAAAAASTAPAHASSGGIAQRLRHFFQRS
ncbi:hypothetical protein AVHY2522_06815 [Acidovorax sp. SUPP2522]|uniref:hypothetical protein n=1 Tax=unclassified Acidovorax TaxID=2684926 RepID=UPI00234AC62F|nr:MULTISPECIES: hypothetical protein [unclassified Acidovorax]WCM96442.1 hypothetical protein M5C96_18680 [Acidovorax sp. GBBC 1281]GKT15052.1 hypothetical protein AVHY2522_06815 [Acidovorax sp. SUPP2522]